MALGDPAKKWLAFLTLTQNSVAHQYVLWAQAEEGVFPVNFGETGVTPIPAMAVKIPANTGTLEEKPVEVEIPVGTDAFLDSLVSGDAQAPVDLALEERFQAVSPIVTGAPCVADVIKMGTYRLSRGIKNPERRPGVMRLEFVSEKTRMATIPLGIAATPRCAWTLGDKTCQATVVTETATVVAVDRQKLSITDPADAAVVTSRPSGYWRRGVASLGYLSIGIRDWVDDSFDFELIREAPLSWVGEEITLRPGCAKTPEACDQIWSNLERFGGVGIKIPSYHPVLETP